MPAPRDEAALTLARSIGRGVVERPICEGTSETCWPCRDGVVEREGSHAVQHDCFGRSVIVCRHILRLHQHTGWLKQHWRGSKIPRTLEVFP